MGFRLFSHDTRLSVVTIWDSKSKINPKISSGLMNRIVRWASIWDRSPLVASGAHGLCGDSSGPPGQAKKLMHPSTPEANTSGTPKSRSFDSAIFRIRICRRRHGWLLGPKKDWCLGCGLARESVASTVLADSTLQGLVLVFLFTCSKTGGVLSKSENLSG